MNRSLQPKLCLALAVIGMGIASLPTMGAEELIENRRGHSLRPESVPATAARIRRLQAPDGFRVRTFAEGVGSPRMIAVGEDGTVYVTRRGSNDVLALRDQNGDGKADYRRVVVRLPRVHGIALRGDKMFLATVNAVYAADIRGTAVVNRRRILSGLPPGGRHPNRTLGFGPDGMLYVSVGSTCNACIEDHPETAAILRARPDGSGRAIFARGLRNTIGFGWHPETGEMWGMDHGSDWLGDDFPPEELNRLQNGGDYGWPFIYAKRHIINLQSYPIPMSRIRARAEKSVPSVLEYTAHSSPLQMAFYTGQQFPAAYRNDAFVAMRGSWNRRPPSGYEVVRMRFDQNGQPQEIQPFLTGFLLSNRRHFGRPVGLAVDKWGSLLVGDEINGVIYRVTYK
ncbi:MAG: PQQ-dependent sugar dehydrogenase [Armatimonadetes bacterium]|nr:PQQ-dependent sugar dehydrogenase [Armatimonadota bacterium]